MVLIVLLEVYVVSKNQVVVKEKKVGGFSFLLAFILSIAIGCVLLFATDSFLLTINYLLVSIFAIIGVIEIISFLVSKSYKYDNYFNLIIGVVSIWLALFIYVYYTILLVFLPIMFSLYAFVMGTITLVKFFRDKEIKNNWFYLIISLVSYLIGILLLFKPIFSIDIYLKVIGVYVIVSSILYLITFMEFRRK